MKSDCKLCPGYLSALLAAASVLALSAMNLRINHKTA